MTLKFPISNFQFPIALLILVSGLWLVSINIAWAESATDSAKAKQYGVTFPIAELGNCESIKECKAYCEQEENRATCTDFAKKKGFHKEEKKLKSAVMIAAAKAALGCSSEEECKLACQKEENREKCKAFAEKYNLIKNLPVKNSLIARAKELLGCKSEAECKQFCSKDINEQKCAELAATVGAKGGFKEEFCAKNPEKCKEFKRIKESSAAAKKLSSGAGLNCAEVEVKCKNGSTSAILKRQCDQLRATCTVKPAEGSLPSPPKPATTSSDLVKGIQTVGDSLSRALDWLSSLFL